MLAFVKKNIWITGLLFLSLIFIIFLITSNSRSQNDYIRIIKQVYNSDVDGIATQIAKISSMDIIDKDIKVIDIFVGNKQESFGRTNKESSKNIAIMQLFKEIPSLKVHREISLSQLANKDGYTYYIWHNVQYKKRSLLGIETQVKKLEIFIDPNSNDIALFKDYAEKDLSDRTRETIVLYETNNTVRSLLKVIIGLD